MMESILHYEIIEKLGEGGMGLVYLAHDTRLKRKVALKFLPRHVSFEPEERERFRLEARAAAVLNHPNIAQVYAIEESEDELFIVMEYIEGNTLKEQIDDGAITGDEKTTIALQTAKGLKTAHDKGIIHRDIKSANIMLDENSNVKIMDFGLARIEGSAHITKAGTTIGTTAYMSPEQLAGNELDARSDIWAYGVVLYELFTGELPFKGAYEPAIMFAIAEEEPVPVAKAAPKAPARIQQVIARCLVKNREERFQNTGDVIDQLTGSAEPGPSMQSSNSSWFSNLTTFVRPSHLYTVIPFLVLLTAFFIIGIPDFGENSEAIPEKKYLAVLPIENIGGNADLQAICEGLAETLSFKLSEIEKFEPAYWVTPASEIRKGNITSATQANKLFGVNLAVLSSIQAVGDSTRLILELVDADNIRRLSTEQVMVSSVELASLEQQGVRAMLKMLHIEINSQIDQMLAEGEPTEPEAYTYYLKGRAGLQHDGNLDSLQQALQNFEKSVAIDHQFALGYAAVGESYWRMYKITADVKLVQMAKQALTKAQTINEDLAPVQSWLGMIYAGTGEQVKAIGHFKKALAIDSKFSPAYRGLANIYNEQGEGNKAVATYRKAIALKPDYWEGYKDLGVYYLKKGRFEPAIKQFQKVAELTPKNSSAYSNLGAAFYYNGDINQARQMFETSLALEKNAITANNLAGIYFWEGDYNQAAAMYEIALETYTDRYEIWGNLAVAYHLSGKPEKAQETYHTAIEKAGTQLEINPNNPEIIADMAAYYSDVGDKNKALTFIGKALGLNNESIVVRQRAVSTYEKMGMRNEAIKWILASMTDDIEIQPELKALVADPQYKALKKSFSIEQ